MTRFVSDQRDPRSFRRKLDTPTATHQVDLRPGDVLMVAKELEDKHKKGKTFTWRFLAMVTKTFAHQRFVEVLVLDDKERDPFGVSFYREDTQVHFIPEGEWPDGVHAFRMKAILDGRVDIDTLN